jgi:signal transduction histidine kinase/CheY-like chemotaxis protein
MFYPFHFVIMLLKILLRYSPLLIFILYGLIRKRTFMELTLDLIRFIANVTPGNRAIYQIKNNCVAALFVSPDQHVLTGMDKDEFERIVKNDATDAVLSEDVPGLLAALQECIRTKAQINHTWRIKNKTTGFNWIQGIASYLGELEGYPIVLVSFGISSDTLNLYEEIINNADTMAFVSERSTFQMLYANPSAENYVEKSRKEMVGQTCFEYIRNRTSPCDHCDINKIKDGQSCTFEQYEPAHKTWELVTCKPIKWGRYDAIVCFIRNINAIKAVNKELEDSEKRYATAVSGAHLGIWEYHVKEHTILSTSSVFKEHHLPVRIDNVPESLIPQFGEINRTKLEDLYRRIDAGEQNLTEDFTWWPVPGEPPICERTFYTVVNDAEGNPDIAYSVSINVTAQMQERENFQKTIQSLLYAYPDAVSSYRLNLTQNICIGGRTSSEYLEETLFPSTADAFFEQTSSLIKEERKRAEFTERFNRKSLLAAAQNGEMHLSIAYQRRHEDNKNSWIRAYFSLVRNPDSSDIECVTYALDITKQVLSDKIFHLISDQEYDYVALLHVESQKFEFLNLSSKLLPKYHTALKNPQGLFNYADIQDFAVSTFIAKEDQEHYLKESTIASITRNLDMAQGFDINIRGHYTGHPDTFMYRKIQHYYLDENKDTILIIQTDVTDVVLQQQRETELAKSEIKRVEDIIDSVATGICVFRMPDADHLLGEFVNLQMFRILGLSPPETPDARIKMMNDPMVDAYMKDAFIAVHPDDRARVKRIFREGFYSKHFSGGNYRIIKNDGSSVWINQDAILREIRPDCRVFYASYRVVEREVKLQAELERQLEKEIMLRDQADAANAAKSDFLSRMSHDIRTPLNGIIGMTYLTQEMDLPEKARENLNKIDTSSKFLLKLINEVLDMSKAESGKIELHPEPYDASVFFNYLDSVIQPLCGEKNIRFIVDVEPVTTVQPLMDTLRINQVFFNLLSNSVKFTPEGGTITYRLREHLAENGRLVLNAEVSDTGIGMSQEFQKHLFEPFSQELRNEKSESHGTGLGLAIVKKILDLMDCTIQVRSEPGKGTTFFLWGEFDCVPASTFNSIANKETPLDISYLEDCHILLCEDHPLNQEIARTLLNEKKIIVNVAEDGQQGLMRFSDSAIGFYAAILMDIRMPVMDGFEATRAIRALNRPDAKTIPIIAMTADAFSDDVQRCLNAGMNDHIAKPIDPEKLFQVLLKQIASQR